MVSRYRLFKERYGPEWDVTTDVGPTFSEHVSVGPGDG